MRIRTLVAAVSLACLPLAAACGGSGGGDQGAEPSVSVSVSTRVVPGPTTTVTATPSSTPSPTPTKRHTTPDVPVPSGYHVVSVKQGDHQLSLGFFGPSGRWKLLWKVSGCDGSVNLYVNGEQKVGQTSVVDTTDWKSYPVDWGRPSLVYSGPQAVSLRTDCGHVLLAAAVR